MTDASAPRTINNSAAQSLKDFREQVESQMASRYGVSFSDVNSDLKKNAADLQSAISDNMSPASFVEQTASDAGFKPASPGFGSAEAKEHNKRQAALVNYARDTPGWTPGDDGIYANSSAGVVRMSPAFDITKKRWDFVASAAEGASFGSSDKPKGESFLFGMVVSDHDIGDAWEHFLEAHPEFADIDPDAEQTAAPRI